MAFLYFNPRGTATSIFILQRGLLSVLWHTSTMESWQTLAAFKYTVTTTLDPWIDGCFFPSIDSHDESPLEEAHAPATPLWALWKFRSSRFLLSRVGSGAIVKHLGGGLGWSDPLKTLKITAQQDSASPRCETVTQLLSEGKSFPLYFSFSVPESPCIPSSWLCQEALLAGLTPVNTSESQIPRGLWCGST